MESAGSGDAIGDLRAAVAKANAELATLAPGPAAYRQRRRQVVRASGRLRERETLAQRRAGHLRDMRLLGVLIGGIVAVAGAGSWVAILAGLGLALLFGWIVGRLPDRMFR
ncbi:MULTISPECIES: hypothetical protein [unclassified Actinoplanes]|uniref:hypothetical protein n=1 Tax=unclassified Actinoplanes TaxID=2626549 RepID=UPI0003014078|nr:MULTISPECIES: hypothetical protein [unclassified Actinoplanes]